jgi:hypothetical protein
MSAPHEKAPDVHVTISVSRPAIDVWRAIADPTRVATWSPEARAAHVDVAGALAVGARFTGSNQNGPLRWTTSCVVVESVQGAAFAFDVSYLGMAVARWRYEITGTAVGCEVEEQWWDRRGPVMKAIGLIGTGVADRVAHNRRTMTKTLAALKADCEADSTVD